MPRARISRPVASITSTVGPTPRRNRRQAKEIGSPAPLLSARPDPCTRCNRCNGVSCRAWARPGSAQASVPPPAASDRPGRRRPGQPARQRLGRAHGEVSFAARRLGEDVTGVALAARIRHLVGLAEGQATGHALGDAGGLQPSVDPVHAVIALDHLVRGGVPLRSAPRTGRDTALAADAEAVLDKHDAVLLALLHRAGRARPDTPRVLAVEARHEHEVGPGQSAPRPDPAR